LKAFTLNSEEGFEKPVFKILKIPMEGIETGHVGIIQNFVNAIISEEKQIAPGSEGINGLSLSNAIHLSSWTDDWVTLPIDEELFLTKLQEKISQSKYVKVTSDQVFDITGSH
jgi:hypothetical protein